LTHTHTHTEAPRTISVLKKVDLHTPRSPFTFSNNPAVAMQHVWTM